MDEREEIAEWMLRQNIRGFAGRISASGDLEIRIFASYHIPLEARQSSPLAKALLEKPHRVYCGCDKCNANYDLAMYLLDGENHLRRVRQEK